MIICKTIMFGNPWKIAGDLSENCRVFLIYSIKDFEVPSETNLVKSLVSGIFPLHKGSKKEERCGGSQRRKSQIGLLGGCSTFGPIRVRALPCS